MLNDKKRVFAGRGVSAITALAWFLFVLGVSAWLFGVISRRGIGALVHYPVPVHRQPAYAAMAPRALPHTERAAATVLSLPMYPELTDEDQQTVIAAMREWKP